MTNKFLIFLLCGLVLNLVSIKPIFADVEERRAELIKVLDEELREIVRLNKKTNGQRADLMLRLAQVLLEKGRLLKDQENQKFLEIPAEKRDLINKDEHFKESKKYFDQASKTVQVLLKKFPSFKARGDAYYILAFNSKELKNDDESKKYFQKSIDESRMDSVVADKSRIALAEIYFNKGSYDKSEVLYEAALKTKRDKWWTKDAFNLSWCYFKLSKYDKAINLMNEAYDLSKMPRYIDMTKAIERDIAFFYTEANRSNEAVAFYKKNGKNVADVLLKVGRYLKNQGKFTAAEKTLTEALAVKQTEKEELEINIELLALYEKYGKFEKHLIASRSLSSQFDKGALSSEQVDILKFNAQKMAAILQQQVVAKTFDHEIDVRNKKADGAAEYFSIYAKLEPSKSAEAYFHAGDTYYSLKDFDKAVSYYATSIELARKNNDKKSEVMAGNSIMASLGSGVKKETSEKYLIPAYEGYLTANPKGEKSGLIYQRLFSAYIEKKLIAEAEKVLVNYKNSLPQDFEPQEKMLAKIMDFYKDSGDKKSLFTWAKKVEANEFKVSPEYSKKVSELLLSLQFDKVEEASQSGNKKEALKGYYKIYRSSDTTLDAKKIAAYNVAVLFFQVGDSKQMFNWADKALSIMKPDEIIKFEKDFILFAMDLFQRRQFNESAKLSERAFDRLCGSDSKNIKVFFKNANIVYLANKDLERSKALLAKGSNCKISADVIEGGYLDHLNELSNLNKWSSFNDIIMKLDQNKDSWPFLIYPTSLLASELENLGKVDEVKKLHSKMNVYYEESKKRKSEMPLEALDAIAILKFNQLENEIEAFKKLKLHFPEKEYNKILKEKFSKLEVIADKVESIGEIGSGIGILKSYKVLIECYQLLKDEMVSFVPDGKNDDYIKSFKKSMVTLSQPLEKQAREFKEVALSKIEKENVLSKENTWFNSTRKDGFILGYFNTDGGFLMDKAGAK